MAPRPCQKPVTGPPGSARALDTILIDGRGILSIDIVQDPPPQAVLAPVPVSLAAVGYASPRTEYKQAIACPVVFQGAAGGVITPSLIR